MEEATVDGFLTRIVQKPESKLYPTGLVVKVPDPSAPKGESWYIQVFEGRKIIKQIAIGIDFTKARGTINTMIKAAGGFVPERPDGK